MYNAMHHSPNPEMSAMSLRETMASHCLMSGNSDAKIMRRSGTGVAYELYPLLRNQITYDRDAQGRFVIVVKESPVKSTAYTVESGKPQDILHVPGLSNDGTIGYSVIDVARQSLGTVQATEMYAGKFFAAGGRTPWLLEMAQKFKTTQDQDKFAADFTAWLSDQNNWHKGLILEPGMTYKNMGMSPEQSQFLESRDHGIPEVCRWFLMTPDMVGDLSRTLASNVENLYLRFIKQTLTSWMTRFEQAYWRCILTPTEQSQGYFFRHNANSLQRGDFQSRMLGYATALQNGYKNIDEVRDLEDDNALAGGSGKAYHVQMNMATLPGTGTPMVAEQGILNRMAAGKDPAPPAGEPS
jgi:HK97 family phage portal protein